MKDSTTSPRSLGQRCWGQADTHTPRWQGGNLLVQTVPWRGPGQPLQITLFCPKKLPWTPPIFGVQSPPLPTAQEWAPLVKLGEEEMLF